MGKIFSKSPLKNVDGGKALSSFPVTQHEEQYEIYDPEKYDIEAVEVLRKDFRDDPEMFILNMLLMSFMFFDDYPEEIRRLANTSLGRVKKLNGQLIKDHQKQMLMPDAVMGSVNTKVKFQQTNGPKKGLMEPLVSQKMYILHDTIEIEDKKDNVAYSRIDKPTYRADIEESKHNKGFVQVKLLGTVASNHKRSPSLNSTSSSTNLEKNSSENVYQIPENDSGFNTGESEYGYSRITAATTPRKLYISEKDIYTSISQLPSKCITPVKVRNVEDMSDSDSDNDDSEHRKIQRFHLAEQELFRTQYYLNSTEFMAHFKNNVFPNYLGEILGFTQEEISKATSIPGAIFCDSVDENCDIIKWEVIPAIAVPWPDEIAFEWSLRRRKTVWDRREKKPIAYKWPTGKMVDEVNKLNCVVVSKGFMPKKGNNPNMSTEWEVDFPKAERYLEFRMSHAQMRIFLYLITLHKKFIETTTQRHGLLIEHIRSLMFWKCEENYKAWPEDKLGTKLKMVLNNLYECMSKAESSQYFIRGKNLLENVPRKYLIPAQDIIHRILEAPLTYALSALKHLKYTSERFYPEPDLDELYKIISSENVWQQEVHVSALAFEKAKTEEETKRRIEEPKKYRKDKEQKWNRRYLEQQRQANIKKLMRNNSSQNQTNLNHVQSESRESIDFDIPLKKLFHEDIARQILLLTFFVLHFIQIAKKSLKISSTNQTMFYLKQAWYLTALLKEIDVENALAFQRQIKEEEENCQRKRVTEQKIPITPKRNSNLFAIDVLQVKGKEINWNNLSQNYNASYILNEPRPSTSGIKKKRKGKKQLQVELYGQNDTDDETEPYLLTMSKEYIKPMDIEIQVETKPLKSRSLFTIELESAVENYKKDESDDNVDLPIAREINESTDAKDDNIPTQKYIPSKDIAKSVSFRSHSVDDIEEIDDDAETTTL